MKFENTPKTWITIGFVLMVAASLGFGVDHPFAAAINPYLGIPASFAAVISVVLDMLVALGVIKQDEIKGRIMAIATVVIAGAALVMGINLEALPAEWTTMIGNVSTGLEAVRAILIALIASGGMAQITHAVTKMFAGKLVSFSASKYVDGYEVIE